MSRLSAVIDKTSYERPPWHQIFMDRLEVLASRSLCLKMNTAASIVSETQEIASGYNGTFSHHTECVDYWHEYYKQNIQNRVELSSVDKNSGIASGTVDSAVDDMKNTYASTFARWIESDEFRLLHKEWSKANEMHAEANALKMISSRDAKNCILYTLYSPCDQCAKDIIAHNIHTVCYRYKYKHGEEALKRLQSCGVSLFIIE